MTKAWPALAMFAILSAARPVSAEVAKELPLELVWSVPAGCPNAPSVRGRIGQLLRHARTNPTAAVAEGRIEALRDGRYRLAMTVRTGDVEDVRTVDAASCSTLAEAFAVVVALAIDPSIAPGDDSERDEGAKVAATMPDRSAPAEPSSTAHDAPATLLPAVPPSADGVSSRRHAPEPENAAHRSSLVAEVALGAFAAWGPLPRTSMGPLLAVGARFRRFRIGATASMAFEQDAYFAPAAGATFGLFEAGAFGGYLIPVGPLAFGPSVSVEATHVRARGFGIRVPWETSATWFTPSFGARGELRAAKWFGLFASADLLLPIEAPVFSLATDAAKEPVRLHSPGRPSPRVSVGVRLVFP